MIAIKYEFEEYFIDDYCLNLDVTVNIDTNEIKAKRYQCSKQSVYIFGDTFMDLTLIKPQNINVTIKNCSVDGDIVHDYPKNELENKINQSIMPEIFKRMLDDIFLKDNLFSDFVEINDLDESMIRKSQMENYYGA